MNMTYYYVQCDGVYPQGVYFIDTNLMTCIIAADRLARKDLDGYHSWSVYKNIESESLPYISNHHDYTSYNKEVYTSDRNQKKVRESTEAQWDKFLELSATSS